LFEVHIPCLQAGIDISIDHFYSTLLMKARQPATVFEIRRASAKERMAAALIAALIVALFATLWGLQKVHFDFGLLFNPCGFKQRTGWPCPACGMTTSVLAFARGQIWLSFKTQPASAFGCLALVVAAFLASLIAIVGVYFKALDRFFEEVKPSRLAIGLLVVISAGWAVTLARALVDRNTGR
jgi:galactitol-specific phosphotransferase system IIC component